MGGRGEEFLGGTLVVVEAGRGDAVRSRVLSFRKLALILPCRAYGIPQPYCAR